MKGISVKNEELVSARGLVREYSRLFNELEAGRLKKVVITKHGKMEAVLISVATYERLVADEQSQDV